MTPKEQAEKISALIRDINVGIFSSEKDELRDSISALKEAGYRVIECIRTAKAEELKENLREKGGVNYAEHSRAGSFLVVLTTPREYVNVYWVVGDASPIGSKL